MKQRRSNHPWRMPRVIRRPLRRLWKYLPWILVLLVVAAGVVNLMIPNPAPWLTPIGDAALIGLVVLYVIDAVQHWASGHRWTAVLMLTLPLIVYALAATAFPDPAHLATTLAVTFIIVVCGAGVFCAVGAFILRHIRKRGSRRHFRDSFPSGPTAFIAVLLLSGVALTSATPSYLDQNLAIITGSASSLVPPPAPQQYEPAPQTVAVPPTISQSKRVTVSSDDPVHVPPIRVTRSGNSASYATDPAARSLSYTVRGRSGTVSVTLYGGLSRHLDAKRPAFYGNYPEYVNDPEQAEAIRAIANSLRSQYGSGDDAARAAISLVQHIPYDYAGMSVRSSHLRHPYQVLYDGTGVCSEKSVLLAALLKELGYGVALLSFDSESHMAVGVSCPSQYAYRGTGYAFIESTRPNIPTYAEGTSVGTGQLTTMPAVIPVVAGKSFASIGEEAADANEYRSLLAMGSVLDPNHYSRWQAIVAKYDIPRKYVQSPAQPISHPSGPVAPERVPANLEEG